MKYVMFQKHRSWVSLVNTKTNYRMSGSTIYAGETSYSSLGDTVTVWSKLERKGNPAVIKSVMLNVKSMWGTKQDMEAEGWDTVMPYDIFMGD